MRRFVQRFRWVLPACLLAATLASVVKADTIPGQPDPSDPMYYVWLAQRMGIPPG